MAGAQREAADPATADAKALGKELSVQPDLTGKGKSTEGSASSSAAAGDKVAEMLGRLNLTSQESSAFVLEDEDDENPGCPEWAFMGKVLAPNPLHISTIKAVLRPAWGNPKGLEIRSMGTNLFMAEFATQADMDRVRGGTPWMISKHGVLLKEFDPSAKHADVCFDRLAIWAQILNLPFGLMNDSHGKGLASNIGKVEKMDVDSKGRAWGEFLRVRVSINAQEPLLRCVSVFSQKRQATDVYQVMYERLPIFCFSCGILGHSSLTCATPVERDNEGQLPYHGPRLCVPEEKKKYSGSRSGQNLFSSNQPAPASGLEGPAATHGNTKHGTDSTGEVTPPKKQQKPRKPRTSRNQQATPVNVNNKTASGKDVAVAPGSASRYSGQKRKENHPKAVLVAATNQTAQAVLSIVPVGRPTVDASVTDATGDGGNDPVADSNKKQKTDSPSTSTRSEDVAAAAEQPCRMQGICYAGTVEV
ncbi:hypothetical protein ACQ4PT_070473 [Festuca glaucescens]